MEKQAKNETPKLKSKFWKFLGVILTIVGLPFFWPFIWFFKWKKQQDVERQELQGKIWTEGSRMKKQGLKVNLFFLRAMRFLGMTGMVWWLPTLFVYRATLHPLVLLITVKTPLVLVGIIALVLLYRFIKSRTTAGGRVVSFLTTAGVITLIYFFGFPVYEYVSILVNYNTRMKSHKFEIEKLPTTAFEKVHAKYTIHGIADHESVDDTKDVTIPHYVRLNDGSHYQTMEVEASQTNWQQFLFDHPDKVFFTKGDEVSPKFDKKHNEVADVNFTFGEFLWLSSNSHTAATKKLSFWQYFRYEPVDYVILLQDTNGAWVQVVPIIKWAGWLFPMPTFGGVMINRQGEVPWLERVFFGGGEFIPQNEINQHPFLKGQSIVPKDVSLYIANTFRVFHSWRAPLPGDHKGDIRIPGMPNEYTQFPFSEYFKMSEVVPDSLKDIAYDGLYQYVPLEPYGDDKHLLSFSLFIRGDDATRLFYFDHKTKGENLFGASAIPAKVMDYNPMYDWDKAVPTEVRPTVRNVYGENCLFWVTSIQTLRGDSGKKEITFGKAEIALIDATKGQVYIHLSGEEAKPVHWQAEMEKALLPYVPVQDTAKLVLPINK